MDGVFSALIAVVGTLLGSTVTYAFQRRVSAHDRMFAAQQQLRSDRMTVYSDFAGALTEFRRSQQDRWHRSEEDRDGPAFFDARTEAYRLRGIALHALFRVQLVASGQALIDTAQGAYDLATDLHKASDRTELSTLSDQAREALERFVELAASDMQ